MLDARGDFRTLCTATMSTPNNYLPINNWSPALFNYCYLLNVDERVLLELSSVTRIHSSANQDDTSKQVMTRKDKIRLHYYYLYVPYSVLFPCL